MTPALKDIGKISTILGVSPLSQSPLWSRPADKISTASIYAFVARMSEAGQRDQAESAIDLAMREVQAAVARNEFASPPMLTYRSPSRVYLTAGELRNGLRHAQQPKAAAILFALETGMDASEVASVTWTMVSRMERTKALSALAKKCILACPQQLRFPYVFWQNEGGRLARLTGLDFTIFEAFGMVWAELENGYANLIRIDEEADRKSIETYLSR